MVQLLTHSDTYLCQPIIQTLCASIFTYPVHSCPNAAGTVEQKRHKQEDGPRGTKRQTPMFYTESMFTAELELKLF